MRTRSARGSESALGGARRVSHASSAEKLHVALDDSRDISSLKCTFIISNQKAGGTPKKRWHTKKKGV